MVSSAALSGSRPQPASSRSRAASEASTLGRMAKPLGKRGRTGKNYSAAVPAALESDWDAAFGAEMSAVVPEEMGGMRLDQVLARLFPQYSRNRLQAWLESGDITVGVAGAVRRNRAVAGG